MEFAVGEAGADEVSGRERSGVFYERAVGVKDERVSALKDGDGREGGELGGGLIEAGAAAHEVAMSGGGESFETGGELALTE
jgi:hypothetical protein